VQNTEKVINFAPHMGVPVTKTFQLALGPTGSAKLARALRSSWGAPPFVYDIYRHFHNFSTEATNLVRGYIHQSSSS